MRIRIQERRQQRDRGLNTISTWTRGTLSGALLLTGGLGAAFAWTAPGHTAKAPAPQAVSGERAGTTAPPTPSARHTTSGNHHAPTTRATVIRPPVRLPRPTTQPPVTTSGGS
jgi:hypothetical protein